MKAIRQNPNDLPEQQSSPATPGPSPRTSPTNCDTRPSSCFELNPLSCRIIDPAIGGNTEGRSLPESSRAFKAISLGLCAYQQDCNSNTEARSSEKSPWASPLTSRLVMAISWMSMTHIQWLHGFDGAELPGQHSHQSCPETLRHFHPLKYLPSVQYQKIVPVGDKQK